MGNDDALYRFRLGVFALAKELGNVRAACRVMGIHHSTFYRWGEPAGTPRYRDPADAGAAATADAERHQPVCGAPDRGVRSGSPRVRASSYLR